MTHAAAPQQSTPWPVRFGAAVMDGLNAAPLRWLSRGLTRMLLSVRAILSWRLMQQWLLAWVRMEAACCRAGSPHYRFVQRYLAMFEHAGTFERAHLMLRHGRPSVAAARLDAWVRIGLLGSLRHELLALFAGRPGVPPRPLMEAALSLSPGCDLSCEGCFTVEDRGGTAPRRERMTTLVNELVSCGAMVIHVVGKGEPFLSPAWASELLDVVDARRDVLFTVATHGMRIDPALAARMGRMGNLLLLVSVDGPQPIHDARRGQGSYRRVHDVMAMLRDHGVLFGFSAMVSARSWQGLTQTDFVAEQVAAGCVVGVYSRYFPLSSGAVESLALDSKNLASYLVDFERLRTQGLVPLMDLDEVEQHTGCHSRAGESVYLDGISGQLSPCLRVPYAPPELRVGEPGGPPLWQLLHHPFFVRYREEASSCPSWCGANLEGELARVSALLQVHGQDHARVDAYRTRSLVGQRRLPILVASHDDVPRQPEPGGRPS